MKLNRKKAAFVTAAILITGLTVPVLSVSAEENNVLIPESSYLADKSGTLSMTLEGGRAIRVKIEKNTLDGVITYYDTLLENDGVYDFTLDSCEYNWYTENYDSSFTVTVTDVKDTECSFALADQVVLDPGFSTDISRTQYDWIVTSSEAEIESGVLSSSEEASAVDGVWYGKADLTMQYSVYTLGDVDSDGEIGLSDAGSVLEYYAKDAAGLKASFTDGSSLKDENIAFYAADVIKDKKVDLQDATAILTKYAMNAAGLEYEF